MIPKKINIFKRTNLKSIIEMCPLKIILNHIRVFKNWLRIKDNLFGIIILGIIALLTLISIRHITTQYQNNTAIQIFILLFNLFIPILLTNTYLRAAKKENQFLLTLMSKSELKKIRQFQTILSNLFIFFILLIFGIIPKLTYQYIFIIASVFILILIVPFQIIIVLNKPNISKSIKKKNVFYHKYNFKIDLPVHGLVIRDILFLWRENKIKLLYYILFLFIVNSVIVFISIRNNLNNLYVAGFHFQAFQILAIILRYPTENNSKILRFYPNYTYKILKTEFIFWFAFFLIYFGLLTPFYFIFIQNFSLHFFPILTLMFIMLLMYAIIIRLAFLENTIIRIIYFLLILIPPAIPFVLYKCFRRFKCYSYTI